MAAKKTKKGKVSKKRTAQLFQSPKGMHDVLPNEQSFFLKIRQVGEKIADVYSFLRIDTPILEQEAIFEKAVGEATDIVQKQMFRIKSRGDNQLVLRPEGTAPIMRSYLQHGLSHLSQPLKLFYEGQMFRHEQPQAGRFRQFHQIGFEVLGADDPIYDTQIILLSVNLLEELKLKKINVQINSIGCPNCRQGYKKKLVNYYRDKQSGLCADCRKRLATNPLRILDCKDERCEKLKKEAPITLDNLCHSCNNHFKSVLEYLDEIPLPYTLNFHLVRGLDYYNKTVFEIFSDGFDSALGGGGRYDYLSQMLGGPKVPAIGVSFGVERLIEVMKIKNIEGACIKKPKVFLIQFGSQAKKKSIKILNELYHAGIKTTESLDKDSLKAQLKAADKRGVDFSLILGQREVLEDIIIIRDMKTGAQETVAIDRVVDEIKKRI
ncbi:MAG: histidine--tRNA ligase [Candidatus Paceibacterota bacterium]|jgi:histidyl-tRNA synthetase